MKENKKGKGKDMHFTKDGRTILYELVTDDKYPFLCEYEGATLILHIPSKTTQETLTRFLYRQFDDLWGNLYDPEYRKFHGKTVVHFLGKPYFPKIVKGKKKGVEIKGDTLYLYCIEDTPSQHKAIYKKFLWRAVEKVISEIYFEAEYDFRDIKMPKIEVKALGRRAWGMYTGDAIYIHYALGRYDPKFIKGTLYHELCHAFILEHNEAFYALLEQRYPGARQEDAELDKAPCPDLF